MATFQNSDKLQISRYDGTNNYYTVPTPKTLRFETVTFGVGTVYIIVLNKCYLIIINLGCIRAP